MDIREYIGPKIDKEPPDGHIWCEHCGELTEERNAVCIEFGKVNYIICDLCYAKYIENDEDI